MDDRKVVGVVGPSCQERARRAPTSDSLARCAAAIEQHAGVRTVQTDSAISSPAQEGDVGDIDALVVLHGSLEHSPAPGGDESGVPVLSDLDALAITLTAAVLTTLSRLKRPIARGRVLVAGADVMPNLAPLLVAAEAGDVTMWSSDDSYSFPLQRVLADADVVVNLLDDDRELAPLVAGGMPACVTPDLSRDSLLVLPALVGVSVGVPPIMVNAVRDFGSYCDVCHACAMALVMATPQDATYPSAPTRDLTERVMEAARTAAREGRDPRYHRP